MDVVTTSSKGLTLKKNEKFIHVYFSCFVYNAVYFSPLQVKNDPHKIIVVLFLGVSMAVNRWSSLQYF